MQTPLNNDERRRVGYVASKMNLCRCGQLDRALRAIRVALESLWTPTDVAHGPEHDAAWEARKTAVPPIWDNDFGLLTYYLLDTWGLTEHGSSIPGWLTDDGHIVLRFLQETDCDDEKWGDAEEAYTGALK